MTCTQQELDAFFEHHGVKGMHWGVRKSFQGVRDAGNRFTAGVKKHQKGLKIAGGVAAITAGAVVAHHILGSRGNISVENAVKLTPPSLRPSAIRPRIAPSGSDAWIKPFLTAHRERMNGTSAADKAYQVLQRQHNDVRDNLRPGQFMRFNNHTRQYVTSNTYGWNPNTGEVGKTLRGLASI